MTLENIFIPIGIDCSVATILKKCNLRTFSLPFDWVVSYNGVSDIISNKFSNYLFPDKKTNISCHTKFVHNIFPNDYNKMNRRIDRFMELLKNEKEQLVFIRKGHSIHHHEETKINNCHLKNDLDDCFDLHKHLKNTYSKLNFKIIIFLCCEKCFGFNTTYNSNLDNIEIFNISKNTTIKEIDNIFNSAIKKILMN